MKAILIGLSLIVLTWGVPDLQEIAVGGWKILYAVGGFLVGWGVAEEYDLWKNSGDRLD